MALFLYRKLADELGLAGYCELILGVQIFFEQFSNAGDVAVLSDLRPECLFRTSGRILEIEGAALDTCMW